MDSKEQAGKYFSVFQGTPIPPDEHLFRKQIRLELARIYEKLTEREQKVMDLTLGLTSHSYSIEEVAIFLEVTPTRVWQVKQNALNKLRKHAKIDLEEMVGKRDSAIIRKYDFLRTSNKGDSIEYLPQETETIAKNEDLGLANQESQEKSTYSEEIVKIPSISKVKKGHTAKELILLVTNAAEEGHTNVKEIAELTGLTQGTVYATLSVGEINLRDYVRSNKAK